MKSVRRVSLVDATVDELRAEISSGRWRIGDRIPSEPALMERLGVSRASLREAIRSLAHAGLLETRQGDGTYVVAEDVTDVALRRRLGGAQAEDVADVRRGLDVVAARLAALRRTDEDLAAIEEVMGRRAAAVAAGDEEAFVEADVAFHLGVACAADNDVLADLYRSFTRALAEGVRGGHCMRVSASGLDPFHDQLLAAIRAQDPTAAMAAAIGLLDLGKP